MDIMRKRGGNREKIGEKRVFVFSSKKIPGVSKSKAKSDWVMHEYVATFLSSTDQMTTMMMTSYTVCKVMFKGDERVLSSSSPLAAAGQIENHLALIPHVNNNSSGVLSTVETEVNHPTQFSGFLYLEEEAQFEDEMLRVINNLPTNNWNSLFNNNKEEEEKGNVMHMQEDRNDYRPKMPLTGIFIDHSDGDDSDSDSVSAATTGSIKTSSSCVSFGYSNHPICLPESPCSTIDSESVTQEVSEALVTNTVTSEKKMNPCDVDAQLSEIGGDQMGQEMVTKRAGFFYRMVQKFTKKIKICSCASGT